MTFAFDRSRHDRQGNRRTAPDLWETTGVRFLVFGGEHIATVDGPAIAWFTGDDVPAGERLWLGNQNGEHYAAVLVDRVPRELNPTSVRVLAPQLEADELSLAIHAVAMGRWLQNSTHCPRCGNTVERRSAGHLLVCSACGAEHFPRTDPAVIMLVIDDADRALIARNSQWPEGRFSTLAGFVEPGETLEDAVRREVFEEVGIAVDKVDYLASQPWPFPSSLMLGFHTHTTATNIEVDRDEIAEARWFTRDELRAATSSGEILLPPTGVSISSWLIEHWLGEPVTGSWF